jgi:cyclic beta-1,2-glucan synthetase
LTHLRLETPHTLSPRSVFLHKRPRSPWDSIAPIREELFSVERLEEHARSLAAAQPVTSMPTKGRSLAGRLVDNEATLRAAYRTTTEWVDEGRSITPAAKWLIDNYHLVERQIRQVRLDMPSGYYRQLPKLATGPFAGFPRVFGMVWAFVAHTDSCFETEMLRRYVRAYQDVQPLTIGELWAVSITLRFVMIENLRRLAEQIVRSRSARQAADQLADRLLGASGAVAEPASMVLASHAETTFSDAFAVQLAHRLRDQNHEISPALSWLDSRLAARGANVDEVVHDLHRRLGASNVSVRNIITSLRLIADVDWTELFESISLVDEVLGADGAFKDMDFPTRNLYRSAIEDLARGCTGTELEIARAAVLAAKVESRSISASAQERRCDPGYHLFAGGRPAFEKTIGFRPSLRKALARLNQTFGVKGYAGVILIVSTMVLAAPLLVLSGEGLGGGLLALLGALGAIPAVDAAVALVNRGVSFGFSASPLPGLELRNGVPSHLRTLVAVPTLLTSIEAIEEQIESLEIHHLASPEGDLHFAVLSDWTDSETEHREGDDEFLVAAARGVNRLNERYGPMQGGSRFLLLHRRRVWNEGEGQWIGWERKRGKLHELNRLLRGATDTSFMPIDGVVALTPDDVRYVITLDADTRLPRDTARRLIGKMAHPLNRPQFDPVAGRVVDGYALLQPRVTPSLPVGREGSLFQRIFSSLSGIDPYASAVSDVYQDLFGEGSYTGKGIYDVDAFEAALAGRTPDSTLLSHDLFEGVFARAGLASDVEVVEEYPARYDVGALRHHRWARGDWQLLPWIFGRGPKGATMKPSQSALPVIGRWKMLDNLRRTLSAPVAVFGLVVGWTLSLDAALVWTIFIISTIVMPTLIPVIGAIPPRRPGITLASHLRALGGDLRLALSLSASIVTFLAHQAWLMVDAIARTLWRLCVTRRHLLEWTSAAQAAMDPKLDLAGFYRRMAGALVVAAAAIIAAWISDQGALPLAAPFVALWFASPAVARWASLPPRVAGVSLASNADTRELRLTARRTWRYFETFVTSEDRMLPPDNFQEDPQALAHRTSPTNLGLYLLSVASARDFGWIGTDEAIERLEATLATMKEMARFRGHFYNWYDTRDLRPLDPKYVSSVDSGNLAGHLIALANTCREWRRAPVSLSTRLAGVGDAVGLTREEASSLRDGRRTQTVTLDQLDDALAGLASSLQQFDFEQDNLPQRLAALSVEAEIIFDIVSTVKIERNDDAGADMLFWARTNIEAIAAHRRELSNEAEGASARDARLAVLDDSARKMALEMEFGFLLDRERKLLSIGYLVPEGVLDSNCYDLLASEARLASFFAIAKGDVPARHWFRLGRGVTPVAHGAALISWSGSMFEYLMPSLVMRAPAGSLLEQTNRLIVRRQIDYAATLELPWGVSESAYNARDLELTYQYSNFGVPGLGLKRRLGEDQVIAPYATALATMIDPRAASANLKRLAQAGARGRYGFYEALDYTPSRMPDGESVAIVRAFMAHHQGMTIVAIADALLNGVMRARFHAEPIIRATELLLQERMPRDVSVQPWATEVKSTAAPAKDFEVSGVRRFASARQGTPATHLLSNGAYAMMLTAAGSGYSRWNDIAVTRWREDAVCDDSGSFVFLRDVRGGEVWSAGFQPSGVEPDEYDVAFHEDRAEFTRRDGTLTTTMEVLVSAEDNAEVRRISISNTGGDFREIEVTSYAELALAPQAADVAHPVFSKLFVETEFVADVGAILATRRRRTPTEQEVWAALVSVVDGLVVGKPEIETDRARFLGRGHGVRSPIAVMDGRALSNTVGTVLDPVFALRRRIRVAPGATVRVTFWTMVAATREALLYIVDKHRDATAFSRAATLAWTQAQVQLRHLGVTAGEAALFQRLASHAIFVTPTLRPSSNKISNGAGAQSGLWAQGVSGDLPVILLRIDDAETLDVARELLRVHEYWRMKQLPADLVILNERKSSYVQDLQVSLESLVRANQSRPKIGAAESPGRVYVLRGDLIPQETHALLLSVARVVLVARLGCLFDQMKPLLEPSAPFRPAQAPKRFTPTPAPNPAAANLEYFNGLGGFSKGGKEYVTMLGPGQSTPSPWINVISNESFGFQTSTEGGGYTWSVNSRENQITPWSNDPVSDRSGEMFYLRDDDTDELWSPTALPIRDMSASYIARYGWGYSCFEHMSREIAAELTQYVPIDGAIKISRLVLRNRSNRVRRLSVTAYVEWVLGPSRGASLPFIMTEIDAATNAMFARNPWNIAFGSRVAFFDMCGAQTDWTGDRREFIGRNGTLASPAALVDAAPLSNTVGAGLDPCGALREKVEIPPNGAIEIVCFLGQADDADAAREAVARYRAADLDAVLSEVVHYWDDVLGTVQVKTPDRTMDIMLNGWLLYQTLGCRVWARSAFYQASGAYGFRDQLQDGMALAATFPAVTREHLLRAAARQFVEGDVQHWWLPHSGQGVRTRISDDRIWLAFATAHYVDTTGDATVLDSPVPFLSGPSLEPDAHENFFQPSIAEENASLFEHCARALDLSLALGGHGLPLFGCGDWNDGMNRVGERGAGESVWLAWLLHATLMAFAPISEARGDVAHAARWRAHAEALRTSLEREAWDGDWYRRGYFDNGAPLGSASSDECRIDSIAQSWAVLSGAAEPGRAAQAMAAVERELIRHEDGLALLFTPPFDKTSLDPGYIKGYPPGIRENGGQYTHAALWSAMAFAKLGDGDRAAGLFSLLNPINHARTRAEAHRYKVEPYVVAADIYAAPPHVGRGGWTWYTGSAAWMQRAGVESILGLRLQGDILHLNPCIPRSWTGFQVSLRHGSSRYEITVENPNGHSRGVTFAALDDIDAVVSDQLLQLTLVDDGVMHRLQVRLG